jgi:hypothetical protein
MRLGVDVAFITVRSLGLLEPIFCVKVLSLYNSQLVFDTKELHYVELWLADTERQLISYIPWPYT